MDIDEVKSCLRALLSSTALSYNVNALLKDFKKTTGSDLPLFGCLHPVEFLKTLKDTVQLFGDPYNPDLALVKSDKSAHIISLVDRQRKGNPKKNPDYKNQTKRIIVPDTNIAFKKDNKNSVLSTSPFGTFIPQEIPAFPSQTNQFKRTIQTYSNNVVNGHFSYNGGNHPQVGFQTPEKRLPPPLNIPSKVFGGSTIPSVNKPSHFSKKGPYFHDVSDNEISNEASDSRLKRSMRTCDINQGFRNKLKKIIKNYPNGLWCCELPDLFLNEYKFVLDYREFGYTSLIQMVSELPDVFRCVRPGNDDWVLFDASVPPSLEEMKMMDKQSTAEITCEVTANMRRLLFNCFESASDSAIELEKVLELHQKMFGRPLDFQSLGFKDAKSLFKTWDGTLLNMIEMNGKTILEPVIERMRSPLRWEEALPPITAENDIFAEIFPKDVVGPDKKLSELDLTFHIAVGQVIQVCVAEVWSPGKFYLQLNKFKKLLHRLMNEMQTFYGVHLNKYKMPEATIRPNQVCVGLYTSDPDVPDEWHRAQILKVINEKLVLVNFVDYGTVTRVKKSQLRFLHKSFQCFPVQGFLAQLSGVAPPKGETKWPMSTSKKFLELSRVPYLDAEIVDIDFEKPQLSVILYDPRQKPTGSINQKLVEEKLACAFTSEQYFDLPERKPEISLKTKVLDDYSSGVPNQDTCNKNFADGFSDVADLVQTSLLFQFKMKSLKLDNETPAQESKEVKGKTENLKYEFEDVQDLDLHDDTKRRVEDEREEENLPDDILEDVDNASPPEIKSPNEKVPVVNGESEILAAHPNQWEPQQEKPKRWPPGFDEFNSLVDLKKINILAMELLATNPSIKQVGLDDPGLALKIAMKMAEVFVVSECPRSLSSAFTPPLNPAGFELPSQPVVEAVSETVLKPPLQTTDSTDVTSKDNTQSPPSKENEYVKAIQLGEKIVHVITIDNELYFSAEEVVRKFTSMGSREIADRVLLLKKIHMDYRVINKKENEKIVKAIKSELTVSKKKSKKLQIYLISIKKLVPYLGALGVQTQSFQDKLKKLQSSGVIANHDLP